jgi:hypothetical protein
MIIVVDKHNKLITDRLETLEINDGFVVLSNKVLVQLDMVETFEVDIVPEEAMYYNGKFMAVAPDSVSAEINSILDELKELDVIVPRIIEDIVAELGYEVHPSKQEVIDKKVQLRERLTSFYL